MGKDKLIPQKLGCVFIEILKHDSHFFPKILEGLKEINAKQKIQIDEDYINTELIYLHIYGYYQTVHNRFKKHFEVFEKSFREELRKFQKETMSEESVLHFESSLLEALTFYMTKFNETLGKKSDVNNRIKFSHYISTRILGNKIGDDIRFVMYMSGVYNGLMTALTELIDSSIELIE